MKASIVTQPDPAGKIQKMQNPREDHSQRLPMNTKTDPTGKRRRYCGLENRGSSSSLNAVLQTLFMTEDFRKHVVRLDMRGVLSDGNFIEELKKLFRELETQEKDAVSSAEIKRSLGIRDGHKRDAADLLCLILGKTPGSSELFKVTKKTTRTCRSCRHKPEEISEVFHSLTVPLQNSHDVEDALQACARENRRVDSFHCYQCRRITDMETKSEMKFPEHLIIQLKRSETHSSYESSSRRNEPEVILRPHIEVSSLRYELYAVVNYNYSKSLSGRYHADIKCEDDIWWRFEDQNVSESLLNGAFRSESPTHRSSEACLLVYRWREQTAGDAGGDQSPRSRDLPLTEEKKSSSLRKSSEQQSLIQTGAPRQGLEAQKTWERDQLSSQPDKERLITRVLEAVPGVTREEAEAALHQNQWSVTPAVQHLKINQLYNLTLERNANKP